MGRDAHRIKYTVHTGFSYFAKKYQHNITKHRRTGNFSPGGGGGGGAVNHLPKKFSQVSQIFTKESKRNESHIATT